MRTRIRFLAQPKSMRSIIDVTQRGQLHGLAWNWCVNKDGIQTKLPPNEFTRLILNHHQLKLVGSIGTVETVLFEWAPPAHFLFSLSVWKTEGLNQLGETKGPWSETRGLMIGGPTRATCSRTSKVGYSNPWLTLFWSDVLLWVALWVEILF